MRVLHIISSMNRGGAETFIMNLYRNIDRSKVQFDFLVHTDKKCDYDDEIRALGGRIFSVIPRRQGIFKNKKALDKFFDEHSEYKIVHQHVSSLTYVEPLKVAKKHDIPIRIVHGHSTRQGGSIFHKYIHYWNQLFIKSYATHYFACSDLAARWLFGKRQYIAGEFNIINNGIETEKFVFNKQVRQKMRKDMEINNMFVLGHVGRFAYPKNHGFLIDIFKAVHDKEPNSVLLLVGDGELRNDIEQKCETLGLKNSVIFTGVRSDIPNLLQAMDVFVMPSHYEGLPVTLVEAQAAGLPCVVSDNITKQVKITKNIEYVKLASPISHWVNKILIWKVNYIRQDESKHIIDLGFDIKSVVRYLQELYTLTGDISHAK